MYYHYYVQRNSTGSCSKCCVWPSNWEAPHIVNDSPVSISDTIWGGWSASWCLQPNSWALSQGFFTHWSGISPRVSGLTIQRKIGIVGVSWTTTLWPLYIRAAHWARQVQSSPIMLTSQSFDLSPLKESLSSEVTHYTQYSGRIQSLHSSQQHDTSQVMDLFPL